jgi:hypothetical protein
MWIRDLHPVDLNEYEVVKLILHNGCIELCNNFSDCSCLSCSRSARYVDAGTRRIRDGYFKVGIDGCELIFSAWEGRRDCGDMKP